MSREFGLGKLRQGRHSVGQVLAAERERDGDDFVDGASEASTYSLRVATCGYPGEVILILKGGFWTTARLKALQ